MFNKKLYPFEYDLVSHTADTLSDGSVAIITRTKNRPVLLARALNSVLEQKYHNWHLYIVNDGGDKHAVDNLVDVYADQFGDKITVIHNEKSLGMEAASNCAFHLANEEFMVIHDDDDSWHPDFLLETVAFLKKNQNAVGVITNCLVIHEEIHQDTVKELAVFEWGYWKDLIDIENLIQGNVAPPICLLIRMSAAKMIGGYNEFLPVLGDWDYNLRLFQVGEIKTLNKKLAYYHHRPNANNAYGNSVIAGIDRHQQYQVEYRNALARQALRESPSNYALLHILLHKAETNKNDMIWHIHNSRGNANIHREGQEDLYEMVYYFYKKVKPFRDFARKLRSKQRAIRQSSKTLRPFAHKIRDFIRKLRGKNK
ncbi:glycosyltransferase family 2 protein [Neisseria sp. CCUG12390]|uniref:glycosyltransferase family 2 protein n=1 Tax=Neisseria sp. CCUG12390 TaxID=3392035 RepID=UPI003A100E5F